VFASELHALRGHPAFTGELDREAIGMLLRHNCIPAPRSIYRGVRKLLPGAVLTLTAPRESASSLERYWSAKAVAQEGLRNPFEGSDAEGAAALESLLREAVGLRMVADVPLGAFLSGGVDSSLVVALMQGLSDRPVRTFSIGSHDPTYDEAVYAASVARHLGTEHTELYVTAEDALAVIPNLSRIYDEPFADSSQIPTYLVSAMARRDVTVALSGDGGDELFGGYNRHVWGKRVWNTLRVVPHPARRVIGSTLSRVPPGRWDSVYDALEPAIPRSLRQQMFGYKMNRLAEVVSSSSPFDLYSRVASHWDDPAEVVRGIEDTPELSPLTAQEKEWDFTAQMMYRDLITYLPDDILTKIDRASMAVSLEARVPLLDHRVVEFAWRLPLHMKIRGGQSKWLLRQVLYKHVPRELIDRPKSGFGVPLDSWLRGPLRDWAESLLDERRLRDEGFFHPAPIRRKWAEHLSGRSSWQYHLWDVLMFQSWYEAHQEGPLAAVSSSEAGASPSAPYVS
jgi:asparagine synthase (glutamine-hydrolysing)